MLLLEVQSDRFRGDDIRAWSRCMVAIDRALSEGQSLVAAIGYELAATIVSRQGLATLVPDLLRSAHGSYQKCGVQAIVQPLVEAAVGVEGTVEGRPQSLESRRNTELSRVIELSREISRELRFERLLHKLVTVLIRDVGGQRCLVLLRQGDVWQVEAEGRDDAATITTPALPAADYREIPWVFISSVIDSHERCVLVDAAASREADPDFLRRGVRSVLCAPILHQGLLRGILYLEDCQHPGVYTYERVQLLGQLTAQISSSIENARLFHDLDTVRDAALLAERAKTRFLLNLSHELRTPLNAVIGYTELIEEEIEDGDTESASEDIASICTATQRLQRTLSSIYALSQIESGRVETDEDDVNVHELLIAVRAKYLPGVEARGLEMGWQLDALDYPFVTDAEKLNYCLMSLVDNASRFTQRGCVRVLASMSVIQGRRWLRVEVSDTGIGISEAEQSTLFDAFRQVDDSTTRAHEGAGVSLAVTREFCHLLGGRLDFQSELGVGSTFTLEIPTLKSQHFARARSASLA
ncbi:MAG: GAF domain-containing sensor histidine kinase [Nannocystaceae bacterium]